MGFKLSIYEMLVDAAAARARVHARDGEDKEFNEKWLKGTATAIRTVEEEFGATELRGYTDEDREQNAGTLMDILLL